MKTNIISRIFAVSMLTTSVTLASNPFDWGWCTYGGAQKFDAVAPSPGLNWNGDAGRWVENSAAKGWVTWTESQMAEPNCLIVWKSVNGAAGGAGHVGFVTRVFNGGFEITEMNAGSAVAGRTDGWTDKAGIYTSRTFTFAKGLDRFNSKGIKSFEFSGYIMPRKMTSLQTMSSLDSQATRDVKTTVAGDSRFGKLLGSWFDGNWDPKWQLRGVRFKTGLVSTTTVYHATHRTDPALRATNYKDPDSGEWIGWRYFRN